MSPCTLYVPSIIRRTAHSGAGANFITPVLTNAQFSQVFRPDDCALWDLNPGNSDKQVKGRQLLLLGEQPHARQLGLPVMPAAGVCEFPLKVPFHMRATDD